MGRFDGKVAVVTGGSRGFGRATAIAFGREGAHVVVNYRRSQREAEQVKEEIDAAGGRALLLQADLAIRENCWRMISTVEESLGKVDLLVNNAGVLDRSDFATQDESTWETMMAVNVWGVVYTTKAVVPSMIRRRYGKIVNITSQGVAIGGTRSAFYAGTKGFVAAFTKYLAQELGQFGINVNSVAPGGIPTDMNLDIFPTQESLQKHAALLPIGHTGVPEDVANCVLFLCSDESNYLTGQTLYPTGGAVML